MILKTRLHPIAASSLAADLPDSVENCPFALDVILSYDTDTKSFFVDFVSRDEMPSLKAGTIVEERAFEKGGCDATTSECLL